MEAIIRTIHLLVVIFLVTTVIGPQIAAGEEITCSQMIHEFDYTDPKQHTWVEEHKDQVLACVETMSCADMFREVTKRQMKEVEKCAQELNYATPAEKKEKLYCTFKCVMKKAKLLTADGKIDTHFMKDMMDRYVAMTPPRFLPLITKSEEMFAKCRNEHESKFDDTEENCASYGPLIQCMMGMMSLCAEAKVA